MARLFEGERTFLHPLLRPVERLFYKLSGVREDVEQHWTAYAGAFLAFHVAKFVAVYAIMRLQGWLPLNPMGFSTGHAPSNATPMTADLAFNTAVSFMTNTNWQSYVGETTMSYFTQMVALAVQNFTSAAGGIAIAIALMRGFARQESKTHRQLLGRSHSRARSTSSCRSRFVAALLFVVAGRDRRTSIPTRRSRRSRARRRSSRRARWPRRKPSRSWAPTAAASSTRTPRIRTRTRRRSTQLPADRADLPDPGRARRTRSAGWSADTRQGWALFAAMSVMFLVGVFVAYWAEQAGNPILRSLGVQADATASQPGGNMEGKEVRFGIVQLDAVRHGDDRRQLRRRQQHARQLHADRRAGAALQHPDRRGDLRRRRRGPVRDAALRDSRGLHRRADGGTDARIPRQEDRAEGSEDGDARAHRHGGQHPGVHRDQRGHPVRQGRLLEPAGPAIANFNNAAAHGFSEMLYAYSSATGNNGSAFAGISANTPWYNVTIGLATIIGRFLFLLPLLAVAGSLAAKKRVPVTSGHAADRRRSVCRLAGRHRRDRGRADVLPGAVAGANRRALPDAAGQALLGAAADRAGDTMAVGTLEPRSAAPAPAGPPPDETTLLPRRLAHARPLFDPEIVRRATGESFRKLDPRTLIEEPRDVRGRGRRGV